MAGLEAGQQAAPAARTDALNEGRDDAFHQLLRMLPVGAYTCNPEGLITYFNQVAVQLWGRAPALLDPADRYCGSFKLFSADGMPIRHDQCWMALALQTGKEYSGCEIIIERADGSRLTALAHATPLRDESGQLSGAINLLVDISDRKLAESAQSLLASIVESSDDAIVSKTLEGQVLTWNMGAERLFGYTAQEMIGAPITRIIPPERLHEEHSILGRLQRGDRVDHYETIRVAKDGHRLDISLTVSPIRDGSGRIIGASKVARDITARKQAEEALVQLKDELALQLTDLSRLHAMSSRLSTTLDLRSILDEVLATAVAIEGADRGVLSLGSADQTHLEVKASHGFQEGSLKGLGGVPLSESPCGKSYLERRRVVVADVEMEPHFAPYRDAARESGFRAVHSTPLVARSGSVVGVLSTFFRGAHQPSDREIRLVDLCARQAVDFIENARLYDQLREADRRKQEFLAMLAHELRNPLAPISNSLQILGLADDLPPAVEQMRDIMQRQVQHLVRLVDDLLEVSRITSGKIELRKERVELASVIRSAVEATRPVIEAAGHQLAISLPPTPVLLDADAVRLVQVFGNLLNNAAKYTEASGQIWLSARCGGEWVEIAIRDNGLGIPPDKLPTIFELFSQIERTRGRAQGGLGIGLMLVRSLVALHGGTVKAKSSGLCQGSEFIVRLPLAPIMRPASPRSSGAALRAAGPAHRILVVDDNRDAAVSLGMLLKAVGHEVQVVHDGAAALRASRQLAPSVVLLDIGMPEMDGYEVARRLRDEQISPGAAIIALTGWGQEQDRRHTQEAGFHRHLVKPVNIAALQALLASLPTGTLTNRDSAGQLSGKLLPDGLRP